jgi:hypothetical protein
MSPVLHHAALGLSVAALSGAALRLAGRAVPAGLGRVVAAGPLAAAAAVMESLALGLVGLGTSTVALLLAALATWLGVAYRLPAPAVGAGRELAAWWRGLSPAAQIAVAATCGLVGALTVWMLRYPELGVDGSGYHLPESLAWLHDGRPGSLHPAIPFLPVENYPLTNEVATGWLLALSRGFAVVTVYQVALTALLGAASWVGLRALRVPPAASLLAVLVLVSLPPVIEQFNGPYTDLPALCWLVCAGALCALSSRHPAALAVALVAVGLAVGTKTTTAPAALLALGATVVLGRPRPSGRALGAGLAAAAVVGGVWYARNLLAHGWPLWPFTAAPWGDPVPPFMKLFDARFIDKPVATVRQAPEVYRQALGGLLVLFPAGLVLALVRRRLDAALAAGAALALVLVWSLSPFTGRPSNPILGEAVVSTTRYLLPALAAGVLAVAVAARPPGALRRTVTALLAVAVAVNVAELADIGFPYLPGVGTLVAGALAGVVALLAGRGAFAAWRRIRGRPPRLGLPRWAVPLAAAAAGAALAPAAAGFTQRHAERNLRGQREVIRWFGARPGFTDGTRPIYAYPLQIGVLAGDRLRHPLGLLEDRGCAPLRRRAAHAWIVTIAVPSTGTPLVESANRRVAEVQRCLYPRYGPLTVLDGYQVYGPPAGGS